jgi:hypothetical protein
MMVRVMIPGQQASVFILYANVVLNARIIVHIYSVCTYSISAHAIIILSDVHYGWKVIDL